MSYRTQEILRMIIPGLYLIAMLLILLLIGGEWNVINDTDKKTITVPYNYQDKLNEINKMIKQYGAPDAKVYTDYRELMKDPTIDAVHVLTPNNAHCEITVAALEAGKHVLCEKPMAATAAEALKMIEARDRTGKMLTIGYQYRHFNANYVAKKVIDEGWIGDVYYAEATLLRRRGVPTWGVFTDKSKQGGGPLIDIGTHALDLALWMMNNYDVEYVVGTSFEKLGTLLDPDHQGQNNFRGEPDHWNNTTYDVEDAAVGQIKMKNGAVINLRASWAINMSEDRGANGQAHTMLAGTKGGLDTFTGQVRLNHIVGNEMATTMVGRVIPNFLPGFSQGEAVGIEDIRSDEGCDEGLS